MAPLKENLKYLLKKHYIGRQKVATFRQLAVDLMPIRVTPGEIQQAIRELAAEGMPMRMEGNMVYFKKEKVAINWGPLIGFLMALTSATLFVAILWIVLKAIARG